MTRCYLGLGSNLRAPRRQLKQAITILRALPRTTRLELSKVYVSKPQGRRAQPTYCNMVISIQTSLPPKTLLRHCQAIEKKQQRTRKLRWGARTLDIDLLLYGDKVICTNNLTLPHPQMLTRDFVLMPLLEIGPIASMPDGRLINTYLTCCEKHVYLG